MIDPQIPAVDCLALMEAGNKEAMEFAKVRCKVPNATDDQIVKVMKIGAKAHELTSDQCMKVIVALFIVTADKEPDIEVKRELVCEALNDAIEMGTINLDDALMMVEAVAEKK